VRLRRGRSERFDRARAELAASGGSQGWFRFQRLADGTTYLYWTDLFEFLISANGRGIWYRRQKKAAPEAFAVYLLGQVLSFSLLSFGVEPLHGTTVVSSGKAVGLLGDCGFGKSTLGAALLARGLPILTDDLIALHPTHTGWMVQPGVPRIKLFPSVARRLLGSTVQGTPMNRGTSKLVLPLGVGETSGRAVPLAALYVLSAPGTRRVRQGCVEIERLAGREAFLEVIRAAFNLLVLESPRVATQFSFARQLIGDVPIRRLTYSRDWSNLSAVCDAVLSDLDRR
jgi:hypothetical protein